MPQIRGPWAIGRSTEARRRLGAWGRNTPRASGSERVLVDFPVPPRHLLMRNRAMSTRQEQNRLGPIPLRLPPKWLGICLACAVILPLLGPVRPRASAEPPRGGDPETVLALPE